MAYAALAAVCVFWGTTYLGIRIAIESVPPAMLITVRYFLSGAILLVAARFAGAHLPRGRELLQNAISGLLILGVGNGALAYAELIVPSGLASLIITISPFWYVIFEAALPGGVKVHAPTVFGMAVGFAGTALLFLPGSASAGFNAHTLIGFLILQVGCIGWCLGSIYQRRQATRAHPIVTGAVQQLACSVGFAPVALLTMPRHIVLSERSVWAVVYLVIFGSIVGYSAFAFAIARLPVAIVSIYPYVNSVVAVALGWLFYREPFGPRELAAMVIIFAGVGIVKWQTSRVERKNAVTV
jgi:drug/metabolite transporter (DMT)-like permease